MSELPSPTPTIFLTGDFNFPTVSWPTGEIGTAPPDVKAQYDKLQQVTSEFFLTQLIEEPTTGNNVLDLLYTNNSDVILNVKIHKTFHWNAPIVNY